MASLFDSYLAAQVALKDVYAKISHQTPDEKRLFFKSHNVDYRHKVLKDGPLIEKFKYYQSCSFKEVFTRACRGTIVITPVNESEDKQLDHDNKKWFFALNKFFDWSDYRKYNHVNPLELIASLKETSCSLYASNKYDGSCIQSFVYNHQIHSYTLGSLDEHHIQSHKSNVTFASQSLKLLQDQLDLVVWLRDNEGCSLVSELCTPLNKIITDYSYSDEKGHLFPLIIIQSSGLPIEVPSAVASTPVFPVYPETFEADIATIFTSLENDPQTYGKCPEGVVVYLQGPSGSIPLFKMKRNEYINMHHVVSLEDGDDKSLYKVQRLICQGNDQDDFEYESCKTHSLIFKKWLLETAEKLSPHLPILANAIDTPKDYGKYLNAISIPTWIKNLLFGCKNKKKYPDDAYTFITSQLLQKIHSRGDKSLLLIKCSDEGIYWFAPELDPDFKPIIAPVVDETTSSTDNTQTVTEPESFVGMCFVDCDALCTTVTESLVQNIHPNPRVVNTVKSYSNIGLEMVFFVDTSHTIVDSLEVLISEWLSLTSYQVIKYTTQDEKMTMLTNILARKDTHATGAIKLAIHIDTSEIALTSSSYHAMTLCNFKSIGIHVNADHQPVIYGSKHKALIITIVDAPGTGKTTILKGVEDQLKSMSNRPIVWLSYDVLRSKGLPPDEVHAIFMRTFRKAVNENACILIDMCHDSPSTLKEIVGFEASGNAEILIMSFIPLDSAPKKKYIKVPSKWYLDWAINNCKQRIGDAITDTNKMNQSTLTDNKVVDGVVTAKLNGCVNQILNGKRGIIHFPHSNDAQKVPSTNELVAFIMKNVTEKLQVAPHPIPAAIYLGLPIPGAVLPILTPDQFAKIPSNVNNISLNHITIIPPNKDQVLENQQFIGVKYTCSFHDYVASDIVGIIRSQVINSKVTTDNLSTGNKIPFPSHPHVTLWIAQGTSSVSGLYLSRGIADSVGPQVGNNYEVSLVPL